MTNRSTSKAIYHLERNELREDFNVPIFACPAWVQTRDVLMALTKYWAEFHVARALFATGVSSDDINARLDELGALLGPDIVEAVGRETIAAFGWACPPDVWHALLHGTAEEREAASTRLRLELQELQRRALEDGGSCS